MRYKYLFFLFLLFLIFSCKKEYEKVLLNYFAYIKNEDFSSAYRLLSSQDQKYIDIESFTSIADSNSVANFINKNMKYKILRSEYSSSKNAVIVTVNIRQVDPVRLYNYIPELLDENISEEGLQKAISKNSRILKNVYIKRVKDYKLVFENGDWKISANFGQQKRKNELLKAAEDLYSNDEYDKALKNYNDVLDFDNGNHDAIDGVVKIEEKKRYIKKYITIEKDIKILDSQKEIFFKITNIGTIKIKRILLQLVYKDHNGKIITDERIGLNDLSLGYNETFEKRILTEDINDLKSIENEIIAIDF